MEIPTRYSVPQGSQKGGKREDEGRNTEGDRSGDNNRRGGRWDSKSEIEHQDQDSRRQAGSVDKGDCPGVPKLGEGTK